MNLLEHITRFFKKKQYSIFIIFNLVVGILVWIVLNTLIHSKSFLPYNPETLTIYNNRIIIIVALVSYILSIVLSLIFILILLFCYVKWLKHVDFKFLIFMQLVYLFFGIVLISLVVYDIFVIQFVVFGFIILEIFFVLMCYNRKHE